MERVLVIIVLVMFFSGCGWKNEDPNCYQVKSLGNSWFKDGAIEVEFTRQNKGLNIDEVAQKKHIALLNVPREFQKTGVVFYVTLHYEISKDIVGQKENISSTT